MKKYNISTNLIRVIKNFYDKATSAVLFNCSMGVWFRTTVGVRQGCLFLPILFNIFLELIVTEALEDHEGTVSSGGKTITNLRFADGIDGLTGEEEELAKLIECLNKASTAYGMEISAEKTKLMTNNTSGINTEIKVNISHGDEVTNEEVRAKIQQAIGPHENLLTTVKRCKMQWYGHVFFSSGLSKIILLGTVKGGRRQGDRGRCGKTTSGNGQAWSSANPRGQWRTGKNG